MDDLEIVAVLDPNLPESGTRHDLEIALDSDAQRIKSKFIEHFGNAHSTRQTAMLAIDANCEASVETHRRRT
jgi:hypothetical protein